MESADVTMFNNIEEMAEAAGLLLRYPLLRDAACRDILPTAVLHDCKRSKV